DERTLGRLQHVERLLDVLRHRLGARRLGAFLHLHDLVGVARAGDDVVGDIEIARAGPAIDRLANRHLDIERDAVDVLDRMRPFADGGRRQYLALLLERAHAVAERFRGAADQDHRPAILLRVGEAGEAVDDAGAGHDDARARPAGQEADGAGRIGRGLLIAHADIRQAGVHEKQGVSLADWVPRAHPRANEHLPTGVAMKTSQDRILTTHVGSLPRPPELRQLLVAKDKGEPYDRAELGRQTRDAVLAI